jgi:ABC-2 type transport system ATP-binding protein
MDHDDIAVKISHLSKDFILPNDKQNSIKEKILHFRRPSFDYLHALQDIDFEVKRGEFFGIVGRNGSGKSTLLKIIGGIYQPSKGSVTVNGTLTPFIELGIGFNPELTGRENVFLNGAILGLTRKEMISKYDEIVAFAELEKFMDQKLKNYSSGMQVRLAFSIAIQAHNDILLIDEVLAVGDANFQRKCFDIFQEIKDSGKTVIFVTHDMGSVQRFCDRGLVLENGKVKLMGSPLEAADAYQEINLESAKPKIIRKLQSEDIQIKIIEHNKKTHRLKFEITYKNTNKRKVYVGFSIVKNGQTIGELNSIGKESTKPSGKFQYVLDTSKLNPGFYELAAGLIDHGSRQLLKATHIEEWAKFNVLGYDETRGAAMYLADNWEVK